MALVVAAAVPAPPLRCGADAELVADVGFSIIVEMQPEAETAGIRGVACAYGIKPFQSVGRLPVVWGESSTWWGGEVVGRCGGCGAETAQVDEGVFHGSSWCSTSGAARASC